MAAVFRALGARNPDERLRNPDYLAERFIGAGDLDYLATSGADYRPQMRLGGDDLVDYLKTSAAVTTNFVRTIHIDQAMVEAVKAGATQVVVLGAGLDSRAYRFAAQFGDVTFFELDHPATQALKIGRVRDAVGDRPRRVRYVPIDFTKDDLLTQLSGAGYREDRKSFFVWEGVVHYIPETAVAGTLRFVAAHSAAGSRIVFDYPLATNRRINNPADVFALWGEPFVFGFPAAGPAALVGATGLRVVSDDSNAALVRRYAIRPDGTSSLRLPETGANPNIDDAGFAIAEKPR
jgi:methyltransferase (TIGR00027 family)